MPRGVAPGARIGVAGAIQQILLRGVVAVALGLHGGFALALCAGIVAVGLAGHFRNVALQLLRELAGLQLVAQLGLLLGLLELRAGGRRLACPRRLPGHGRVSQRHPQQAGGNARNVTKNTCHACLLAPSSKGSSSLSHAT